LRPWDCLSMQRRMPSSLPLRRPGQWSRPGSKGWWKSGKRRESACKPTLQTGTGEEG